MAKQQAVKNDSASYIRKTVLNALNSDPEIKMAFLPSELGFKSGAGSFVVVMNDGERYRCNLTITQGVETE